MFQPNHYSSISRYFITVWPVWTIIVSEWPKSLTRSHTRLLFYLSRLRKNISGTIFWFAICLISHYFVPTPLAWWSLTHCEKNLMKDLMIYFERIMIKVSGNQNLPDPDCLENLLSGIYLYAVTFLFVSFCYTIFCWFL